LDLSCLDDFLAAPGESADYLVHGERDAHAQVSFTAWAVPQLRALGWRIEIAPEYPYRLVATDAPLFAALEPDEDDDGWFGLELGVLVDGKPRSLLPAIVELIERGPANLAALRRMTRRFVALEVSPGEYAAVPPERLGPIIDVLVQLARDTGKPGAELRMNQVDARLAAQLGSALGDDAELRDPEGLCARGQ